MRLSSYFVVFLKGVAMGAADIVPGVSGGTVAFITGIYDELLNSIKSLNPKNACLLFTDGPRVFWQIINGNFLISLIAGIIVSFLSLAHLITYLMAQYPILLWAFFFGLVAASAVHIAKHIEFKSALSVFMSIVGLVLAFYLTTSRPISIEPSYWAIFAAGAIAICAMILPGISGSFILLLLGLYGFILTAVKTVDLQILALFIGGCLVGLLSFVHILSWLLNAYRSPTIALLTGFLIGSLNALWPWKQALEFYQSSEGLKPLVQQNIMPAHYTLITGQDAMLPACAALAVLGVIVVLCLERFSTTE